ncbi:MAG: Smr/MutS family protein [Micropepsaceae bacterium]
MVRKRDLREDERELWDHVTRDVRRGRARVPKVSAKPAPVAKPFAKPKTVDVPVRAVAALPAKRPVPPFGVDGATAERLRRGKIEPDAKIDLHGMTQAQAHARLATFVRRGHEIGNRCVLVITGKGSPLALDDGGVMPQRSKAGVLRTLVPLWLEELRAIVTGVQAAHQKHGGGGAFYVYLRRKRAS